MERVLDSRTTQRFADKFHINYPASTLLDEAERVCIDDPNGDIVTFRGINRTCQVVRVGECWLCNCEMYMYSPTEAKGCDHTRALKRGLWAQAMARRYCISTSVYLGEPLD
jgi:hypothetical protein